MVMEFTYQSLPKQGDNSWPPMGVQEFFLLGARGGLITVEKIRLILRRPKQWRTSFIAPPGLEGAGARKLSDPPPTTEGHAKAHMALDELHARRLATIGNLFDAALDRMALVLRSAEPSTDGGETARFSAEQTRFIRDKMAMIRSRLHEGLRHFSVALQKPEPKQMLVAELSTLWVILENARPERMTGYGREFTPADKADWENLIQALGQETELIRSTVLHYRSTALPEHRPQEPEQPAKQFP